MRSAESEVRSAESGARLPIMLAVDTSSPRMSLALARGEQIIAAWAEESRAPHSQTLFIRLAALLDSAQLEPANVDAFAVATGPGSFTGLRVGLAAVKGLAHTLGRAAIGITALDGLALAAGFVGQVVVMIEAGRGEVYCGWREVSADGEVMVTGEDRVGPVNLALARLLSKPPASSLMFVGEGARRYRDEIAAAAAQAGTQLQTASQLPSDLTAWPPPSWQLKDEDLDLAPHLALRASRLFRAGDWPGAHAYYLRPSDAELKCR